VIVASGIAMQFGAKPLFSDVAVKFDGGYRYGLIGANGSGKSTFMKIQGGYTAEAVRSSAALAEQATPRGRPATAARRSPAR
jgi:ATPase subunit of ABC transporter with duplicated ATPase domains